MRSQIIKQLQSIGIILPFDYNIANPPKIIPIVFFGNKAGNDLRSVLQKQEFVIKDFQPSPDNCCDLVFIRRNYDGSELYYFVNSLTYDEIRNLSIFVKESKGGMLL